MLGESQMRQATWLQNDMTWVCQVWWGVRCTHLLGWWVWSIWKGAVVWILAGMAGEGQRME